jgi:sec-independent protein translocase protein TatB
MFDVSWSELLILGLVALIVVGPKDLPRFLNMLGRYAGVVRRQATEFRSVFDQAMREAEMNEIQKEVRAVSDGVKASLDEATRSVESVKAATKVEADAKPAEAAPKALAAEDPVPSLEVKPDLPVAAEPSAAPEPGATDKPDVKPTVGPA